MYNILCMHLLVQYNVFCLISHCLRKWCERGYKSWKRWWEIDCNDDKAENVTEVIKEGMAAARRIQEAKLILREEEENPQS